MAKKPLIPTQGQYMFWYCLAGMNLKCEPGIWCGSVVADLKDGGKQALWLADKGSQETELLLNRAIFCDKLDQITETGIQGVYYVFCATKDKRDSLVRELIAKAIDYQKKWIARHTEKLAGMEAAFSNYKPE